MLSLMEDKENEPKQETDKSKEVIGALQGPIIRRSVLKEFDPLAPESPVASKFHRNVPIKIEEDIYEDAETSLIKEPNRMSILLPDLTAVAPETLNDTTDLSYTDACENISSHTINQSTNELTEDSVEFQSPSVINAFKLNKNVTLQLGNLQDNVEDHKTHNLDEEQEQEILNAGSEMTELNKTFEAENQAQLNKTIEMPNPVQLELDATVEIKVQESNSQVKIEPNDTLCTLLSNLDLNQTVEKQVENGTVEEQIESVLNSTSEVFANTVSVEEEGEEAASQTKEEEEAATMKPEGTEDGPQSVQEGEAAKLEAVPHTKESEGTEDIANNQQSVQEGEQAKSKAAFQIEEEAASVKPEGTVINNVDKTNSLLQSSPNRVKLQTQESLEFEQLEKECENEPLGKLEEVKEVEEGAPQTASSKVIVEELVEDNNAPTESVLNSTFEVPANTSVSVEEKGIANNEEGEEAKSKAASPCKEEAAPVKPEGTVINNVDKTDPLPQSSPNRVKLQTQESLEFEQLEKECENEPLGKLEEVKELEEGAPQTASSKVIVGEPVEDNNAPTESVLNGTFEVPANTSVSVEEEANSQQAVQEEEGTKSKAEDVKLQRQGTLELEQLEKECERETFKLELKEVKEVGVCAPQAASSTCKACVHKVIVGELVEENNAHKQNLACYQVALERYQMRYHKQVKELDALRTDLNERARSLMSAETLFSELVQRFEMAKSVIEKYQKNEEISLKNLESAEAKIREYDMAYSVLKQELQKQNELQRKKIEEESEKCRQEMAKLQTTVKRLEIKNQYLENAVKQKTEECQNLAALCDSLTEKVL